MDHLDVAPPINPWDAAKSRDVRRRHATFDLMPLDDGAKFFVLMLEQLGCRPWRSYAGDDADFFILFHGPAATARAVAARGHLDVTLHVDGYRLDLTTANLRVRRHGRDWSARARDAVLRRAATAWVLAFGPLAPAASDDTPPRPSRSDLEYGTIALSGSGRPAPDPYPPVPERWRHEAAGALAPPLSLWLLERDDGADYDEHDGAVVRAADEAEARRLVADLRPTRVWGAAAAVACTRLGAADGGDAAIVLASFHAG